MTKSSRYKLILMFLIGLALSGCINVQQRVKINEDGSGIINLEYWTNTNLVDVGDIKVGDEIGGFTFDAPEIVRKYSSAFTEVSTPKKSNFPADTTTHIQVDINFKDINKITEANGYSNIEVSYAKGKDNTQFRYYIPKDTTLNLRYTKEKHTLEYIFEFPFEVMETNGTIDNTSKEKNVVKWKFQTSDHAKKDFEMTAVIKNKSGICGMFGIELPLILLFGLVLLKANSGKNKKSNS